MEGYGQGAPANHPQRVDDHCRMVVAAIKDIFNQPSYRTFAALETMLLNVIRNKPFEDELQHLLTIYGDDVSIESPQFEFDIFNQLFKNDLAHCFDDIHNRLERANEESYLTPNVITICKLLLVNPATGATPERPFSLARKVKTWMRTTMFQKRFNALAILNCHKVATNALDLVSIGKQFTSLHKECYQKFAIFRHQT